MCLVLTWRDGAGALIVAANRDEWRGRPAAPLHRWPDGGRGAGLLGGRDLQAGGSWMLVHPAGRFVVVTNVREPGVAPGPLSRGELPLRVLEADDLEQGVRAVWEDGARYSGFHVLAGDPTELWHTSNRGGPPTRLAPGLHGVSNGPLGAPWPKVVGGLAALADLRSFVAEEDRIEAALLLLQDRVVAPDAALPDTGVGRDMERALSPRFIDMPAYGTRCSTVLLCSPAGVRLVEQSWDPGGGRVNVRT